MSSSIEEKFFRFFCTTLRSAMKTFTNALDLSCGRVHRPGSGPDAKRVGGAQDTHTDTHPHAPWQLHRIFKAFSYLQEAIENLYSGAGFCCSTGSDGGMAASSTAKDEAGSADSQASWNQRSPRRCALELPSADATTAKRQSARRSKDWDAGVDDFTVDLASSGPMRYGRATVENREDGDETTAQRGDAAQESKYEESWHELRKKKLYTMAEMLTEGPGCLSERDAADLIIMEDRAAFEALGWDRLGMKHRDQLRRQSRQERSPTAIAADIIHIRQDDDEEPSHSLYQQNLHGVVPASPRSVDSMCVDTAECSSNAPYSLAGRRREQP